MPALPTPSQDLSPVPATNGNLAAEPEQPAQDGGSPDDRQLHIDVGASTSEAAGDSAGTGVLGNGLDRRESRSSAEDSPAAKTAVRWVGPPDGSVLAKLEGPDGVSYVVTKRRVVIGRESTHSETDMIVQENNYVSRGHLVLSCRDDGVWTIVCNGKNGVFVNSHLVKKGAEPAPVPKICSLRFPSTSIRVGFQSLAPVAGDAPMPTATAIEQGAAAVKAANASRDSGFVSPSDLVSPVRTVISPSSGAPNTINNNSKSLAPSASPAAKSASGELSDGDDADGGGYDGKPPFSYAQLIIQAIASTVDKQMTLSGIYAFITKTYPWYRTSDKGWQNSIRHNLSLNRYFIKVPRSQEEPGKGSFWRLDPGSEIKLLQFAFKKRRQRGGGKGVRCGVGKCYANVGRHSSPTDFSSAPVSPGLEGSKSDGELHEIFPDDVAESGRATVGGRSAADASSGLSNSNHHQHLQLGSPTDAKTSIPRPSSLSGRVDGVMVRPSDFHSMVRTAGTPDATGPSPTSLLPSETSTPRIVSAKDGKGVFRFSPIETNVAAAGSSRYIQSAPCSPKGFGKDGFPKREHHHSGGPFRVRTSAKDGRHRLQLCHSPPEYVPVTRADVSALQMLTQGRQSSKTLLQHYRGGSQSLSTTPVREILAGGPRMHQLLSQDDERIAKALLNASPEPKVLKRRIQENGHHTQQQQSTSQHASSSLSASMGDAGVFVQPQRAAPAAPTATIARPDLLHFQQQQQQQQQAAAQQALAAAQAYSNQLAAAAYLNPMLPAWAAHAQQNAVAAAGLYPPGSFLSIGGAGRFPLIGAAGQGLLGLDSARLLAALGGGNVGGPSVPKIARTE